MNPERQEAAASDANESPVHGSNTNNPNPEELDSLLARLLLQILLAEER